MRDFFSKIARLCFLLMLFMGVAIANEPVIENVEKAVIDQDAVTEEKNVAELNEAKLSVPIASGEYKLKSEGQGNGSNGTPDIGEVFIALMAILGLIVVLAWATKRLNLNGMSINNSLKLQSVLSLGSKEKVIVVEVEGKKLLLGVTPQSVNLICHLDNQTNAQDISSEQSFEGLSANTSNEVGSFAQQIKKALTQGKIREDSKTS